MDNFKLTFKGKPAESHIHFCGLPTGVWIESGTVPGKGKVWYLYRPGMAPKQAAWFKTRRDVKDACHVFIEGATQQPDESPRNCAIRALQLCLETGSTDIIKLTKEA